MICDFCTEYKCEDVYAFAVLSYKKSVERNALQDVSRKCYKALKTLANTGIIAISTWNVFHYYALKENQWKYLERRFNFLNSSDTIIGLYNTEVISLCIQDKTAVVNLYIFLFYFDNLTISRTRRICCYRFLKLYSTTAFSRYPHCLSLSVNGTHGMFGRRYQPPIILLNISFS